MASERRGGHDNGDARQRVLRQAAIYTYGFIALAVVVAVGGSAFLAWVFTVAGLPFFKTWLVLTCLTLGIPLIGQVVLRVRAVVRRNEREREREDSNRGWSDG